MFEFHSILTRILQTLLMVLGGDDGDGDDGDDDDDDASLIKHSKPCSRHTAQYILQHINNKNFMCYDKT